MIKLLITKCPWRKWAWLHYQAAQRAWQRAVWAARLKYYRAVRLARPIVAPMAQLLASGVINLAAIVDLLTRAQLGRADSVDADLGRASDHASRHDDRLGRTLDAISQHQRESWLDAIR